MAHPNLDHLQREVANALLDIGAVGFSPQQPITFKSGMRSPIYVDNRRVPFHPKAWRIIMNGFRAWIREDALNFDAIAGIEAAGIPHSAALGYATERPSLFVRKQPKGHGKGQQVEGGDVDGLRVLLVEDLVSTGSSSLAGVEALRSAGALVTDCIAIVSYGFAEAQAAFEAANVRLHVLAPFSVITEQAVARGMFDAHTLAILQDWHQDPYGWAGRQGFV